MNDVRQQYLASWQVLVDLVDRVPVTRWRSPTPCPAWPVAALVGHLIDGARQAQAMLTGQDAPVPVADPLALVRLAEPRPDATLRGAADALAAAVDGLPDEAVLRAPRGLVPAPQLLGMALIEPVVHGWDLAVAAGQRVAFPDGAVQSLLAGVQQLGGQLAATGMYEPATTAPETAAPLERLAAALGREVG